MGIRHASEESLSFAGDSKKQEMNNTSRTFGKIADVPDAPSAASSADVGTARAYNNGAATVSFTPATTGGAPTTYTVTSTPGSFTGTGASSPVTISGLASATSYTFTVNATNSTGTSGTSNASGSITATTVPGAPTVGTPTVPTGQAYGTNANVSVPFSAPASSGGKAISSYTVTSSSGNTGSGSSSPINVSDVVGTARTYTVTATNANGTSSASSSSSSVTPTSVPQAPTIGTAADGGTGTTATVAFTAGATGGSSITGYSVTSSPTTTTQSASSSPYTFTGLTAGTAYTFQVAATNANGTSSYSSASNSVTPIVPSNFFSIATVTAAGGETSLSFTSIPSTYTHLQIRGIAKDNVTSSPITSAGVTLNFNNDLSTNYAKHTLYGNGSTITAGGVGNYSYLALNGGSITNYTGFSNVFGTSIIDIFDYASTTKNKTIKAFSGGDSNTSSIYTFVSLDSGVWLTTSQITSIKIADGNGSTFVAGTTFALYGVK